MDRLAIARGRYGHLDTAHIAAIARGTNDVDRRWRQEQVTDEFLLALFFGDGSRAPEPWEPTRRAIERYTVCASAAVRTYGWQGAPDTTCALLRSASEDSIAALRRTLIQKYREFAVARH